MGQLTLEQQLSTAQYRLAVFWHEAHARQANRKVQLLSVIVANAGNCLQTKCLHNMFIKSSLPAFLLLHKGTAYSKLVWQCIQAAVEELSIQDSKLYLSCAKMHEELVQMNPELRAHYSTCMFHGVTLKRNKHPPVSPCGQKLRSDSRLTA